MLIKLLYYYSILILYYYSILIQKEKNRHIIIMQILTKKFIKKAKKAIKHN